MNFEDDEAAARCLERVALGGSSVAMPCGCIVRLIEEHPTRPWIRTGNKEHSCEEHKDRYPWSWRWVDEIGRHVGYSEFSLSFYDSAVGPLQKDAVLIGRRGNFIRLDGTLLTIFGGHGVPEEEGERKVRDA